MPLFHFHLTRTRSVSDEGVVRLRAASLNAAERAYESSDLGYNAEDEICWDETDEYTESNVVDEVEQAEDDGSDADLELLEEVTPAEEVSDE